MCFLRAFGRQDSMLGGFGANWGQDDSRIDLNDEQLTMATTIMQLADAQSLFKPFLQSIGLHVEGVRPSAMMKKFGGNLSLQGKFDYLKIQIAESDRKSTKNKGKSRKHPKWNISLDTPAFLCEDFSANVNMNDVVDFELKETGDLDKSWPSGRPMNFAMHKLEAKPTTLQVNFMMNIQAVTQYVDMPLLRLIHQFVMMAENVADTKHELKTSHSDLEWIKTHRKQDSKGSTSSADTAHSDISVHSPGVSPPQGDPIVLPWVPESHPSSHSKPPGIQVSSTSYLPNSSFTSNRPSRLVLDSKRPIHTLKRPPMLKDGRRGLGTLPRSRPTGDKSSAMDTSITSPQSLNLSDSVTLEMDDMSSPLVAEKTLVDQIKDTTPKCWKTLYHLLELYSTMPETKTVGRRASVKLPVIHEEPDPVQTSSDTKETPTIPSETLTSTEKDLRQAEEGDSPTKRTPKTKIDPAVFKSTSFRQSKYTLIKIVFTPVLN